MTNALVTQVISEAFVIDNPPSSRLAHAYAEAYTFTPPPSTRVNQVVTEAFTLTPPPNARVGQVLVEAWISTPPSGLGTNWIPQTHVQDAIKLTSDGRVELYKITLRNNAVFYLKNDNPGTWQGNTYEMSAIKLSGLKRSATGEASRPTLSTVNPGGAYSSLVAQGLLEKGTVTQYRVLYQHLIADIPICQTRKWVINRVASLDYEQLTVELRDQTDLPNMTVPARMYLPPAFPLVSLQ